MMPKSLNIDEVYNVCHINEKSIYIAIFCAMR